VDSQQKVTFPQYRNQSSRRQYPGMTMPDRDSKPATIKTILVLDDDVLVRMPVVQFLRDCGHRVVEAASTDEATMIPKAANTLKSSSSGPKGFSAKGTSSGQNVQGAMPTNK
jgi:PleD family two-component response regulator